ncbi:MAG: 2'-5' RNA ligase family protein [Haloferacaceae archaeon]
MYSLNVPVPGDVERLAGDLHARLLPFDRIRERHTLVVKRLGDGSLSRVRERLRTSLAGAPAFEARVAGVDYFADPPVGSAPVVYLAVESPGVERLHRRLVGEFDPVSGLEGDDYVPHVTLARGGSIADAEALTGVEFTPVTWTVSRLELWDATHREAAASFGLPT